jgi:hypothetical protein
MPSNLLSARINMKSTSGQDYHDRTDEQNRRSKCGVSYILRSVGHESKFMVWEKVDPKG